MKSLRIQDATFPIIANVIQRLHSDPAKFVSREEIAQVLLRDTHSRKLVEAAYQKTDRKKSIQKYAGNLVDWFSQRWTVGAPKWLSLFQKFERSENKIGGHWAYRPCAPSAVIVFPDEVEEQDAQVLPEGGVFATSM